MRLPVAVGLILTSTAAYGGESGLASYYDGLGNGGRTCAHRTRPLGTLVTVIYGDKSVQCRIDDRGPFMRGRIIDVSIEVAKALGMIGAGIVRVTLE